MEEQQISYGDQALENDPEILKVECDIINTKAALARMSQDDEDIF
ncbi:MAG TPA: hypothetical protein VNJ08_04270 [Bacteriovoracaceae bacterium]|nr:hypothetical protein [Bacteriovoracaceae bacterium]